MGLTCAPETEPTARMIATNAAPVATAFSSNARPTSFGLNVCAAMPEPTTAMSSNPVPDELGDIMATEVGAHVRSSDNHRRRRHCHGGLAAPAERREHTVECVRHRPVVDPVAAPLTLEQTSLGEHAQEVAHGWLRQVERISEMAHARFVARLRLDQA
jgi:hypothetical protein